MGGAETKAKWPVQSHRQNHQHFTWSKNATYAHLLSRPFASPSNTGASSAGTIGKTYDSTEYSSPFRYTIVGTLLSVNWEYWYLESGRGETACCATPRLLSVASLSRRSLSLSVSLSIYLFVYICLSSAVFTVWMSIYLIGYLFEFCCYHRMTVYIPICLYLSEFSCFHFCICFNFYVQYLSSVIFITREGLLTHSQFLSLSFSFNHPGFYLLFLFLTISLSPSHQLPHSLSRLTKIPLNFISRCRLLEKQKTKFSQGSNFRVMLYREQEQGRREEEEEGREGKRRE